MKKNEEEIQRQAERGVFNTDTSDGRAYRQLFRILEKEPEYALPDDFASKVLSRVRANEKGSSFFREYFWLGAGIFLLSMAAIITLALLDYKFDLGFLKGLGNYKGVLIFGSVFIAMLNFLDKKILPHKSAST